jgi:hypothetical protein
MLKTLVKVLAAGTVGFASIIGGYLVLSAEHRRLPAHMSDLMFITVTLTPIPIGMLIAWVVYRMLDSGWSAKPGR